MTKPDLPWIEVGRGRDLPGSIPATPFPNPPGNLYHALFASRVNIRPFAELLQSQWGFNSLLGEALDRQRLFIESQHPADDLAATEPANLRTLALRCLSDPASAEISLILLGKICGLTPEAAHAAAADYWCELQAIFPSDYLLEPIASEQDFHVATGWKIFEAANTPEALAEIRRFEGVLTGGSSMIYLLGNWRMSQTANEQIWRALAGCPRPVLFDVTLRPTVLLAHERFAIAEMAEVSKKAVADPSLSTIKPEAEWVANVYAERFARLHHPYIVQVHLVSPGGIPDFLGRAIGSALAHSEGNIPSHPGCQMIMAESDLHLAQWRTNLFWLESGSCAENIPDRRFVRLRHMADAHETQAVFRLPFPPKGGIPGVTFHRSLEPVAAD